MELPVELVELELEWSKGKWRLSPPSFHLTAPPFPGRHHAASASAPLPWGRCAREADGGGQEDDRWDELLELEQSAC